jgi:hypothetical protein
MEYRGKSGGTKMRKLVYLLIAVSLMLALFPAMTSAHTEIDPFLTDLKAGQHIDVGDVLVWNDGDMLYLKYVITDTEWCITETHLQVATALDDIPQKNGNPIPGKFEENDEHDCVTEVLYTYNLSDRGWNIYDDLFIAAHAVVQSFVGYEDPNLGNFAAALPAQVTMSVQYPQGGGPAYFPVTTVTGDPLTGTYEGWCIDTDHVIYQNTNYTANVYSSYEELPAGLVEFPENLDLVNWIINQGFVGQPSPGCSGSYTYGDVQRAIWALIEDGQSTSGLGSWSQCRVDEILAAAGTNGESFVPGCDDYVAVILQPVNTNVQVITIAQVTFASVGVPCTPLFQYETAWGAGSDFPGKNWATYLEYTVQEACPYEPDLVNGGFEAPVVDTSQGWDIYDSGTPELGWAVEWYDGGTSYGSWTRPEPAHLELHESGTVVDAHEGNQYAELDTDWDGPGGGLNGEPASVKIYQVLETCPDQEYTLTYAWRGRPGYGSALQVNFADYSATHSNNSSQWNIVEITATATDWTTTLEFIETGSADSFGMFLDAVSVTKCDSCTP